MCEAGKWSTKFRINPMNDSLKILLQSESRFHQTLNAGLNHPEYRPTFVPRPNLTESILFPAIPGEAACDTYTKKRSTLEPQVAGHPRVPYPNFCDWRVDEIFRTIKKSQAEGKRILTNPESVARVGRRLRVTTDRPNSHFFSRVPAPDEAK